MVKEDLHSEEPITDEHVQNNRDIRSLLMKRGIQPESLPADEDLKMLERRVRSQECRIAEQSGKVPKNDNEEER